MILVLHYPSVMRLSMRINSSEKVFRVMVMKINSQVSAASAAVLLGLLLSSSVAFAGGAGAVEGDVGDSSGTGVGDTVSGVDPVDTADTGDTGTTGTTETTTTASNDDNVTTTTSDDGSTEIELSGGAQDSVDSTAETIVVVTEDTPVVAAITNAVNSAGGSTTTADVAATINRVVGVMRSTPAAAAVSAQIQSTLVSLGVPAASIGGLMSSLQGLMSDVGVGSASLTKPVLVASSEPVRLAQASSDVKVDPTKLANAINAYNKIIMEADSATLRKLAADPEFQAIGNTLRVLRSSI